MVLSVLAGEMSCREAARRLGVSADSVVKWKHQFLEAGAQRLQEVPSGPAGRKGTPEQRRLQLENEQLKLARAAEGLAARRGAGRSGPFVDLEALREAAGLPVSRFCVLAGIPERTYRRRLARLHHGAPSKGPWPASKVDRIEALAAKYAEAWPAWGYRKIAALMRADGHDVTNSSVQRALRRRGLLLPQGFRADRKSWAVLRRKVFRDPPTERNRVWQTDFSEFETTKAASGASARSSTTPPNTASPSPCLPPAAAPMPCAVCSWPSPKQNTSSISTT